MTTERKPLAEVSNRAIALLCRELGAADTVRFLNQFTLGHGDYTAERDALFGSLMLDEIVTQIREKRTSELSSYRPRGLGRH